MAKPVYYSVVEYYNALLHAGLLHNFHAERYAIG